jgi:glycerol-3-phosphate dehydrogenase
MTRDLDQLVARTFDVLVIGGGIYGLTIACDAAQRGLSVALVERNDFGSGASFNHLRTIHGGLRYLQTLDLRRARESVRERRMLARIAPAAVQPLPFVLPLTRSLVKGKLAMRAGFLLDRAVARDRNIDVPDSHRLPAGRVLSRADAIARFRALQGTAITGAAVWYDYVTTEPNRLTLAWALAAVANSAVLANYLEATELILDQQRVAGVRATDRMTGRIIEIAARITVNATGGALDQLLSPLKIATGIPMLKAMNLVTGRDAEPAALGGRTRAGRYLFMVPWQKRSLFGTWESTRPCAPDDRTVQEADVASFLRELGEAYPALKLTVDDVTLVHRGVVPAVARPGGAVALAGHEQVRDHTAQGISGLISVAGTKYTTARAVAERVTNRLLLALGHGPVLCRTATTPLPWSGLAGDALLAAAARNEMVVTLADAVIRRTPLGGVGPPTEGEIAHAADIVGRELAWDGPRKRTEIEAVLRFYN